MAEINILDIVLSIRECNPDAISDLSDERAVAILRRAFFEISKSVDSLDKGMIRVQGLGVFLVKRVERTVDGVPKLVRRVVFRSVMDVKRPEG